MAKNILTPEETKNAINCCDKPVPDCLNCPVYTKYNLKANAFGTREACKQTIKKNVLHWLERVEFTDWML